MRNDLPSSGQVLNRLSQHLEERCAWMGQHQAVKPEIPAK